MRKILVLPLSFIIAQRGYGATVARLTPDQTVGRSNRSGLILFFILQCTTFVFD